MKIEISIGELVDKVSILDIKLEKIKDAEKLKNIQKEHVLLCVTMENCGIETDSDEYNKLKEINTRLWEIEDNIRIKEANQEFDAEFIKLARSVYFENDDRAEVKREINLKFGSKLVEEKEYVDYKKLQ